MNYKADYNGITTMWEDREIITPVLKQILSEYKAAFEVSSIPSINDLVLHRLIEFSKNPAVQGYCGLYCYVFNESQIAEIISYIEPFRTVAVQHNGGFITLGIDMNYKDSSGRYFKPNVMFFRQDDIGWIRSMFRNHNVEPIEYGYMLFAGSERQKSVMYESADEYMDLSESSLPTPLVWAINAGDLVCAILNNDEQKRITNSNKLNKIFADTENDVDSMIERVGDIRRSMNDE